MFENGYKKIMYYNIVINQLTQNRDMAKFDFELYLDDVSAMRN